MEPASATGASGGGNRQLKRWGPIAGVVAVVAIVVGVVVATGGDDGDGSTAPGTAPAATEPAATTAPDASGPADTSTASSAPGEITYPLTFSQAEELGVVDQIEWGDRCDTTTGRLAVPDYFAPECYAPWPAGQDNGGATAQGVTADEVTVVYYEGLEGDPIIAYITDAVAVDDTNDQQFETMQGLVEYYEQFYEMYGRKVNLVTYEGTGIATDEVSARADAVAIAEQYQPFAVLGGPALTSAFADELAARDILCVGCTPGQPTQFYVDRDPYVWSLGMSALQQQAQSLEFLDKQIIGKNAEFGGDAVKDQPRSFGLLYLETSASSKELADNFASEMEALGAPFTEVVAYQLDPATIQQQASQVITKMKAAGVTTIVFTGDPVAPRDFTREATAQEYFPEWFFTQSALVDTTAFARSYDQEQWRHAFGMTTLAARGNPTTTGSYNIYNWFKGTPPPADDTIGILAPNAALFFGIMQGVGPELTAEHWRDALFAWPGSTPAISQPYLSYGDKGYWGSTDFQGIDDATIIWWNPDATGPDEIRKEGQGMYVYVDGGTRYLPGEWPSETMPLFDPANGVTIYMTPPPGEEVPTYPSPAG